MSSARTWLDHRGKNSFNLPFKKTTYYLRDHYVTNVRRTYGRNPAPDPFSNFKKKNAYEILRINPLDGFSWSPSQVGLSDAPKHRKRCPDSESHRSHHRQHHGIRHAIVGCRHGESRFRQIIGVIEIPVIPVKLNAFVLLKSHYSKHQTQAASWEDAMISLKIL